jgi:HPt (histidine-containing phosphotransfer) domain-containing protein
MADKDLGEMTENFEEEVENLKNTKMKLFGITMTPATIMGAGALVSAILGSLYGGFEVYKDYMEMKEKLANLDVEAIEARNAQIEIKLDEAIDYTRDIKDDLRQDILNIEDQVNRMDDKVDATVIRVEDTLTASENRIKDTQRNIENTLEDVRSDMNQVEKDVAQSIREVESLNRETEKDVRDTMRATEDRIDADMRQLESDLTEMVQEALDNPLNDM